MDILKSIPDGYIFKMKKINDIKLKDALKKLKIKSSGWTINSNEFNYLPSRANELYPLVEGEIEFIEIKAKNAYLNQNQKISYPIAIKAGFCMHFFRVECLSFEHNKFKLYNNTYGMNFGIACSKHNH